MRGDFILLYLVNFGLCDWYSLNASETRDGGEDAQECRGRVPQKSSLVKINMRGYHLLLFFF